MSRHVQGSLAVISSASGRPLIVAAGRTDGQPGHGGDVAKLPDTPEGWATARLFAAAPEMLEALRLVEAQHSNGWNVPCIAAVRRAIAEATS